MALKGGGGFQLPGGCLEDFGGTHALCFQWL